MENNEAQFLCKFYPHKTTMCNRIRFWHKDNQKLIFEEGGLERLDHKVLEDLLALEYKISTTISRN